MKLSKLFISMLLTAALTGPAFAQAADTPVHKNALVLSADWQAAQWSLQAKATRFGPLKDFSYDQDAEVIDGVNAQRFGAVWTLDLEAQYKLTKQLTVAVGGDNILDRYPQRVRQTNNATYGGALPYNFINPIGLNGAYFYGRLRYTF